MAAPLSTLYLGLFGHPVAQSYSPRIHKNFALQFGLKMEYQVFDVDLAGFADALEYFRLRGGNGCNITMPLKRRAFELAASCSPAATAAGAVNTLNIGAQGQWHGDNTDGAGLVIDLRDNLGLDLHQRRICIVGAGGAANGILGALLDCNPETVIVANRSGDKAEALAERFSHNGNIGACDLFDLDDLEAMDLVINATSLGHQGEAPALSAKLFKQGGSCYDLNYGSASRPLQQQCDALGIKYFDGLGMLLEQAACSFELWTGSKPTTSDFSW